MEHDNIDRPKFFDKVTNKEYSFDDCPPFEPEEESILFHLADAYNEFISLKGNHPSYEKDFSDAIHTCQRILGQRVLRRMYPRYFGSYDK